MSRPTLEPRRFLLPHDQPLNLSRRTLPFRPRRRNPRYPRQRRRGGLARKWNDYSASIRAPEPDKSGFFGALPSLTDVEGSIEALKYALDELKADGTTLFTSYDGKYLGDKDFEPISISVMLSSSSTLAIHPRPLGRAPNSLIPSSISRTRPRERPAISSSAVASGSSASWKNILAHAGGTLPFRSWRLMALCSRLFSGSLMEESLHREQIL